MSLVRADLSAWTGSEVQVRWHAGEDEIVGYVGWHVDSVTIGNAGLGGACASAPPPALDFYSVTPCRMIDTRNPDGPLGGPALQTGPARSFALTGLCGVPLTAKALSVNVTVTQPAALGNLIIYPGGQLEPNTNSISFGVGQTRANNLVMGLGDGTGIWMVNTTAGPVHFILDVTGYFQ
jgi:hypothetical protein